MSERVKSLPFSTHEKAQYWHPTLNGNVTTDDITCGSHKKIWFKCHDCNHDFEQRIYVATSGCWCPYCCIPRKKICDNNNCECFNISFASHEKAEYWHPTKNNNIKPRDIMKGTQKKYWFKCHDCPHSFESSISNIVGNNQSWCPYCCEPQQKLCDNDNCEDCFNASFASHEKAKCWHPTKNGNIKPRNIMKGTPKKYWFICEICKKDLKMSLDSISGKNTWCTCKKNKTEQKVKEWLKKNKNILFIKKIKPNYSPKWANRRETHGTGQYKYDIYIELINGVKIIIEIDGPQHYKKINYFKGSHCVLHTQIKDEIKQRLAGKNEHNLIRVNQEDIWHDKNNWEDDIIGFINKKYENNDRIDIYNCADGERYNKN